MSKGEYDYAYIQAVTNTTKVLQPCYPTVYRVEIKEKATEHL